MICQSDSTEVQTVQNYKLHKNIHASFIFEVWFKSLLFTFLDKADSLLVFVACMLARKQSGAEKKLVRNFVVPHTYYKATRMKIPQLNTDPKWSTQQGLVMLRSLKCGFFCNRIITIPEPEDSGYNKRIFLFSDCAKGNIRKASESTWAWTTKYILPLTDCHKSNQNLHNFDLLYYTTIV